MKEVEAQGESWLKERSRERHVGEEEAQGEGSLSRCGRSGHIAPSSPAPPRYWQTGAGCGLWAVGRRQEVRGRGGGRGQEAGGFGHEAGGGRQGVGGSIIPPHPKKPHDQGGRLFSFEKPHSQGAFFSLF